MKYFSIPADYNTNTIYELIEINNKYSDSKVHEVYGNITVNNSYGSGRSVIQLPRASFRNLEKYSKKLKDNGINFNYTINTSFLNNIEFTEEGVRGFKTFLSDLYNIGIENLTIALPSLMDLVKSMPHNFKIKASVICCINNANKAKQYLNLGVHRIVTEELINRDFKTLKRIRAVTGENVEVIVNSPCHIDCAYRMLHYNQQSGDSISKTNPTSFNYYEHICMQRRYSKLSNFLRTCFIRPEDLKYYQKIGINNFKIQGRQTIVKGGNIIKVVKHYCEEDFDGNVMDLTNCFASMNSFNVYVDNKKLDGFLKPFFEKDNFCQENCDSCHYCDEYALKAIKPDQQDCCDMAVKFYKDYDEYRRMTNKVEIDKKSSLGQCSLDSDDFNL